MSRPDRLLFDRMSVLSRHIGLPAVRIFLTAGFFCQPLQAAVVEVSPGPDALRHAIAAAAPGDTLHLLPGRYDAATVDRTLELIGTEAAIIDADGKGSALIVTAPKVVVRGVTVTGSGKTETDLDSGILVVKGADEARIENNHVIGNLFGIAIQGAQRVLVLNNEIKNRDDLWLNDRGNGINIWDSTGSLFEGNRVSGGRDGLYIHTAHGNTIRGNRFRDLRFAVHYMYANRSEVTGNLSINNSVGYALMSSEHLIIRGNFSLNDRDHGLMFHASRHSELDHNLVLNTKDKCVFIYTSSHSKIHHNRFEGCEIGIHFTGGSEKNLFYENAFVNNRTQVKYSGMVQYEWSREQRGNYWSDNAAFDLNGDGIADVAYRPNSLMDRVVWNYPLAKLLLASPVMETLRVAQGRFPTLSPGGVVDSWPLIAPPPSPSPPPPVPEVVNGP
ncbi:MAG: nitrous oxide reductase family maturation protein NosD [Magnetococcales bacterium]|nr:nitrous oxide reductase family maturation protein NosD [Magnetococcales bacterium]